MSAEMNACPFCGGKPHSRTETDLDGFGRFYWFECGGCKARSGEKFATETCPQFYEEVRDAWNRRTDLSQASVAAALEAAADRADVIANGHRDNECSDMAAGVQQVADEIRALITQPQHYALAAHVAAEVAKALAEDAQAVKMLVFAAQTFCNRVEAGEIRSKRSYAMFKDTLAQIGAKP